MISYAALALLCLMEASLWLLPWPELSGRQFLGVSAAGFLLLAAAVRRRSLEAASRSEQIRCIAFGVGAIGVPSLLAFVAQQHLSSVLVVASFAAVPTAVTVAADAVLERKAGAGRNLIPALVGLSGVLLLLPVALPETTRSRWSLALVIGASVFAGAFSVLCHREMRGIGARESAFLVALGNGIVLGAAWILTTLAFPGQAEGASPPVLVLRGSLLLLGAAATIWLIRTIQPEALASRFLFVPLIGFLEAYGLMRPTVSTRAGLGAVLILTGGVLLLRRGPAGSG